MRLRTSDSATVVPDEWLLRAAYVSSIIRTPMKIVSDAIARLVQAREHLADVANNPFDFNVPVEAIVDIKAIIQHIDELTMRLARAESKSH
jgi:hypothetical protein